MVFAQIRARPDRYDEVPMLQVVQPIAAQVVVDNWSSLLLRATWSCSSSGVAQFSILEDWPPADWTAAADTKTFLEDEMLPEYRSSPDAIVGKLRWAQHVLKRWAPAITGAAAQQFGEEQAAREKAELEDIVGLLADEANLQDPGHWRNHGWWLQGGGGHGLRYNTLHLFTTIRFGTLLRDSGSLSKALKLAMGITLPPAVQSSFAWLFETDDDRTHRRTAATSISMSKATMVRSRFCVDAAYALWWKSFRWSATFLEFFKTDSSPQARHDLQVMEVFLVREDDVLDLFEVVHALVLLGRKDALSPEEEDSRAELGRSLTTLTYKHFTVPQGLGRSKGSTSVENKASCCLSADLLEWPPDAGADHFVLRQKNKRGGCTDQGTESGMRDYKTKDYWDLLPEWRRPVTGSIEDDGVCLVSGDRAVEEDGVAMEVEADGAMEEDGVAMEADGAIEEDGVAMEADGERPAGPELPSEPQRPAEAAEPELPSYLKQHLYPMMIHVPGFNHIINNASNDMHEYMPGWQEFIDGLKLILLLLGDRGLKELFIARCVRSSAFAAQEHEFRTKFPKTLALWRWLQVVDVLADLIPLEFLLRSAWKLAKFKGAEGIDDGQPGGGVPAESVKPRDAPDEYLDRGKLGKLDATINSDFWWSYARMSLLMYVIVREASSWIRSCPCHQHLWDKNRGRVGRGRNRRHRFGDRVRLLRQELHVQQDDEVRCPSPSVQVTT
jgi:hypothetical protein